MRPFSSRAAFALAFLLPAVGVLADSAPTERAAATPVKAAAPAAATPASGASGGAASAAAAGADKAPAGPIEALVIQKKYEDAILEVKKLRASAKKPLADAESEFWAARAEVGLKLEDAAHDRFTAIARAYPDSPRGGQSAIEATTSRLGQIEGRATSIVDRKLAEDSARDLEATAKKFAKDPDVASRALYIAGNAWKMRDEYDKAEADYRAASKLPGSDYPAKALYMLGMTAARKFDAAGAKSYYSDCLKRFADSTSAEKCRKGVDRMAIVGLPAPPLQVETWVSGLPQDLASLKGKVVLIWFFATWCPHCKATMPEMAALAQRMKGKPFVIMGITNNTHDQTTESAKAFVADPQWGITYPAAVDKDAATTEAYEASGIPQAVLIDKQGIVRWTDHPAYLDDEMITRLLGE